MKSMSPDFASSLNRVLLRQSQIIHTRNAGTAVTRVVRRCNAAMEEGELDLSECQLMQVPDAVYHLMRNTTLRSCDLSANAIAKISPKFPMKFTDLTSLDLSNNKLAQLPDEMALCTSLSQLDISHNAFIELPHVVFRLNKLKVLKANNNLIIDVDVSQLPADSCVEAVDLSANPLLPACHQLLSCATHVHVTLSPRPKEDWEDLDV